MYVILLDFGLVMHGTCQALGLGLVQSNQICLAKNKAL